MARTRNDYRGDVLYDVWRSGGNPDAVDYDRVDDAYAAGDYAEDVAASEVRRQRRTSDESEEEEVTSSQTCPQDAGRGAA